jgi:hypothetical protein
MANNQPFGDVFAKVRGDKLDADQRTIGDKLIKVGAAWRSENGHLEFTFESEPIAWRTKQPGFAFPQSRSFILIERGKGERGGERDDPDDDGGDKRRRR